MDIIESVAGKLNLNLGNMNNPNIIIEGIKMNNNSDEKKKRKKKMMKKKRKKRMMMMKKKI